MHEERFVDGGLRFRYERKRFGQYGKHRKHGENQNTRFQKTDRRAEQYAEASGQMEYNIGVVKAEQERIQAEEYYAEQARQKAEAQKQAAKAKADKARAQANAKANAAKKAKQDKLDALALRERELKVRLAELKVQEREAQVGTSVAEEAVRTEKAREKVELELERTRAEIKKLDQ